MVPSPGNTYTTLKNALIHDMPRKQTKDINEKEANTYLQTFLKIREYLWFWHLVTKSWNVSPNETVFVLLSQAVSLGNILALRYPGNWGQGTADLKVPWDTDWNPVWKGESISPTAKVLKELPQFPLTVIEMLYLVSLQSEETSAWQGLIWHYCSTKEHTQ